MPKAEADLAPALLAAVVENSEDAILSGTLDGVVTSWNRAAERLFGYAAGEIVGRHVALLAPPGREHEMAALHERVRRGERVERLVAVRRRKDGTLVEVSLTVSPVRDRAGRMIGVSAIIRDLTERERAERVARRQARLLDLSREAILAWEPGGAIVYWNTGAQDLYGYSREEALGRVSHELLRTVHPTDVAEFEARLAREGHRVGELVELVHTTRDGRKVVVESRHEVLREPDGSLLVLETNRDITERKRAEARLREGEARFRAMADNIPVLCWMADAHGWVRWYNRRWYEYTGTTPADMEGWGWRTVHDPEVLPTVLERWRASIAAGEPFETTFSLRGADGRFRTFLTRVAPVRDEAGRVAGWFGSNTDVTERERAEARLRSILETAPEAVVTIDERGLLGSFSPAAEALFGYAAEEVVGRNVSLLMAEPHRSAHDGYLARYLATGERRSLGVNHETEGLRKDGTTFPMELAVGEAHVNGERFFTGFAHDLTARKRLERELRQAQKMEAVGQLTGGVAHDFNNLLTVVLGNLEMLEERLAGEDDLALLRDAREAARLGAELTGRLLAFARRQPLRPRAVDLGQAVPEAAALLRRTLGEAVELRTVLAPGLPPVLADPGQLQNALLNLAINARDAMPAGGRLTIEAAEAELDADAAETRPGLRPGRYVTLAVADTGAGMAPEVRERAFEPFFTTKGPGAGSGLGLSMVYGFARQSGGHAEIYSEPGLGTVVSLYLPRAEGAGDDAGGAAGRAPASAWPGRGETVLVAEDEPGVRRVTARRLRGLGYAVLEAADGPSALAVMERHPEVALLLTDMVMPGGMTGAALAAAARARRPGLAVVVVSGYAAPESLDGLPEGTAWLRKPYAAADLARALRRALDQEDRR